MRIQIDAEADLTVQLQPLLDGLAVLVGNCILETVPLVATVDGDLINELMVVIMPRRTK